MASNGYYQLRADVQDKVLEYAQESALSRLMIILSAYKALCQYHDPKHGAHVLTQAQTYADVYSEATAQREHHRAVYHKAFPLSDVFRLKADPVTGNMYESVDVVTADGLSPWSELEVVGIATGRIPCTKSKSTPALQNIPIKIITDDNRKLSRLIAGAIKSDINDNHG